MNVTDAIGKQRYFKIIFRGENVELTQITAEIHTASKRLSKGADALFLLAKANAEAEQQYRAALAKEIVKLKLEGMSVWLGIQCTEHLILTEEAQSTNRHIVYDRLMRDAQDIRID
jgi:hypothetical protein